MSRRREYARRLEALGEIAGIMSAMKALATMEIRRLRDDLSCEQRQLASLEECARAFLAAHPDLAELPPDGGDLCVLLGSEQGFCGDYNEALRAWLRHPPEGRAVPEHRIVLGQRLAARLDGNQAPLAVLPGASVSDELPGVLQRLSAFLLEWLEVRPGAEVSILYHSEANGGICLRQLLPMRDVGHNRPKRPAAYPAELQLAPVEFFSALSMHYLYAALNGVLHSGLMAENRQRLAHMESALRKLEDDQARLQLVHNAQRQEEITEEIEIIQLSAGMIVEETLS